MRFQRTIAEVTQKAAETPPRKLHGKSGRVCSTAWEALSYNNHPQKDVGVMAELEAIF
jgi:hypothetical protein